MPDRNKKVNITSATFARFSVSEVTAGDPPVSTVVDAAATAGAASESALANSEVAASLSSGSALGLEAFI